MIAFRFVVESKTEYPEHRYTVELHPAPPLYADQDGAWAVMSPSSSITLDELSAEDAAGFVVGDEVTVTWTPRLPSPMIAPGPGDPV